MGSGYRQKFGDHWLSVRRNELGISQEALATRLQEDGVDVARPTIAHWERGTRNPPLENAEFRRILADALELTPSLLLERAGYEVRDRARSEITELVAEIVEELPPEEQQIVLGLAQMIQQKLRRKRNTGTNRSNKDQQLDSP